MSRKTSKPAPIRPHELLGSLPDPDLEMALDGGRDGADILGLILRPWDAELVHIDIEAGAPADTNATPDPDAGADASRNHRSDRHALGRVAEEWHLDAVCVVEIGDESEPAAPAHIVHDQTRGLLRLVLSGRTAASEQASRIEAFPLRAEVTVDVRVLHLAVDACRIDAGERDRPHADLPIAHMHGDDQDRPPLLLVARDPVTVGDVEPIRLLQYAVDIHGLGHDATEILPHRE